MADDMNIENTDINTFDFDQEAISEESNVSENYMTNTTTENSDENTLNVNSEEIKFKKSSFLDSKKYKRDLINALLEDDKEYTKSEVDILIDNFRKGKVN